MTNVNVTYAISDKEYDDHIKEGQSRYSKGMKARMEAHLLYLINDLHHRAIESYGIV